MGIVSPAGNTPKDAYAAVLSGEPRAGRIPAFVEMGLPVTVGCAIQDFCPETYFSKAERRRLDRTAQLGVAAAVDAIADAGPGFAADPGRSGVYVGSGTVSLGVAMELTDHGRVTDTAAVPVATVPTLMPNATAAWTSIRHGLQGPCLTINAACASGAMAIGEAVQSIRAGRIDCAVAGGVDAPLVPAFVAAFDRLGVLSRRNDAPAEANRPFDGRRDGFVLGEGAAFLTLERAEDAEGRGARIHGEITGYAVTSDAAHIAGPRADGALLARTMTTALDEAGLAPHDIGHVSAHGSSTRTGDRAEAAALRTVFGGPAAGHAPPITAVKGVTGYLLGAGGAFEAAIALLCARDGLVPPVPNFGGGPDSEGLDIVTVAPRRVPPAPALSVSTGFGGQNAALVLDPAWDRP